MTGVTAYPVQMSSVVREGLVKANIAPEIIQALEQALAHANVDGYAFSYACGVERAYREYGIEGVHDNCVRMLINLGRWQGEEARAAKKILKKWRL